MPAQYNPKKHKRHSIRLQNYDYTQPGTYFITICTYQRFFLFGELLESSMHLNHLGLIAQKEWLRLPFRFRFLELGLFVVMPNHLHGLLVLLSDQNNNHTTKTGERDSERFGRPVSGSIPTIVRAYKSAVTWRINQLPEHPTHPIWHRNYYEHIVRDEADQDRIQAYIQANPRLWDDDQINSDGRNFHPDNQKNIAVRARR